jgi:hypothetical protein
MTQAQKTTIESALKRAQAEGIRIIGNGTMTKTAQRFWLVSSQDYCQSNRVYVVRQMSDHLACNCPTRRSKNNPDGVCKHRAVAWEALKDERAAQEEPAHSFTVCACGNDLNGNDLFCQRCLNQQTQNAYQKMYQAALVAGTAERFLKLTSSCQWDKHTECDGSHCPCECHQQAEAEHLASQPRELAGVTETQEQKLEQVTQNQQVYSGTFSGRGFVDSDPYSEEETNLCYYCGVHRTNSPDGYCSDKCRKDDEDLMELYGEAKPSAGMLAQSRRHAAFAEMECAMPVDSGSFSIYKS